ncbi:MAG: HEAT repeat domain-containing protein [Syntrophaceae bacterium]|nr:HEAT repeat domain-containing protein [Syntrophaceae bacterium]
MSIIFYKIFNGSDDRKRLNYRKALKCNFGVEKLFITYMNSSLGKHRNRGQDCLDRKDRIFYTLSHKKNKLYQKKNDTIMKTGDSTFKEEEKGIPVQQADDTKKLFAYLLLAGKNVSLYPEGHSISINSIRQFHETLESYIGRYGDIRIQIEKDRVICQGLEVHTGPSEEGTLPFTLFRDGIRWLEFTEGIEMEEIRKVLSIIHRYSVLTTEPEGDIVTAFWESHFNHVLYKADDFLSGQEGDQADSLSALEAITTSGETGAEAESKSEPSDSTVIDAQSIGGITIDSNFFLLTPEEETELREMISREEKSSATEHLNMLLDMILQSQQEQDFNVILEVLSEEFTGSFNRHEFTGALIILNGIKKILDGKRLSPPGTVHLMESFYKDISSDTKCLKPLEEIWSSLNVEQTETLKQIFQHLTPGSVPTLLRFLLLGQSSQLEQTVEDVIISLARQDISCLEQSINTSDEKIVEKLVSILSKLKGDSSFKYLMKLARHSSASVRRMTVKTIGLSYGNQISAIFDLINDPDASVHKMILTQMGQSRNETAENFLMQYLQKRKLSDEQTENIIECFKTLGKCGSSRSVPFLRETLLHKKWLAGFKKSAYREGAALALVALKTPEARQVIEEAGRSFYPGLRKIARKAGKEFFKKK